MRYLPACALLLWLTLSCMAQTDPRSTAITLVLQFEGKPSAASVEVMKQEFDRIMQAAGLTFQYRLRSELDEGEAPAEIIYVKFRGECRMVSLPPLLDERGPFAITHSTEGQVLRFSEVACDRVRVSVRSAMHGDHFRQPEAMLGRALGRVLAHEVYHIIGGSAEHGKSGIAREGLSGAQLTSESLQLHPEDAQKLRKPADKNLR